MDRRSHSRSRPPVRRRTPPRARAGRPHAVGSSGGGVLQSYRRPRRQPNRLLIAALVLLGIVVLWKAAPIGLDGKPAEPRADTTAPAPGSQASVQPAVMKSAAKSAASAIKVPSYLGGAKRNSYGVGPAPSALNLRWKLNVGAGMTSRKTDGKLVRWAGTGWTGQPTVVAEKGRTWLMLGAYDHNLHRIDAETGKVAWEADFGDVIKGTNTIVANPAPRDDVTRIIVVSGARRGTELGIGDKRIAPLRAVSFKTGKELWRLPVPKTDNYSQDVDGSPLWYRGVLYASLEPGYVYALDPFRTVVKGGVKRPVVLAKSPRLYDAEDVRTHPDIDGANLALEGSPAAIGDRIYVASGSGHVYGLDRKTLKVVWNFEANCDIDSTPVVTHDGKLLVGLEAEYTDRRGGAYLLDPSKPPAQAVVWYYPTANRGIGEWAGGCVGSVAVNDATNDGSRPRLAALNTVDGYVRVVSQDVTEGPMALGPGAKREAPAPHEVFMDHIGGSISTPVIVGDAMIAAGYGNTVNLYRFKYTAAEKGAEGALPSPDGRWWKVTARKVDSFRTGGPVESTPLVWKGRVYIGCRDGYLYCLGG